MIPEWRPSPPGLSLSFRPLRSLLKLGTSVLPVVQSMDSVCCKADGYSSGLASRMRRNRMSSGRCNGRRGRVSKSSVAFSNVRRMCARASAISFSKLAMSHAITGLSSTIVVNILLQASPAWMTSRYHSKTSAQSIRGLLVLIRVLVGTTTRSSRLASFRSWRRGRPPVHHEEFSAMSPSNSSFGSSTSNPDASCVVVC